jgi:LysM repeat protein
MRPRTWCVFVAVNGTGTAGVLLTLLFLWTRANKAGVPLPTITAGTAPVIGEGSGAGSSDAPTSLLPTSPPTPATQVYIVQPGDTLVGIARMYQVTIEELMALNSIGDPNLLQVGQMLTIPAPPPGESSATMTATEAPAVAATPDESSAGPSTVPTLTPSGAPVVEIGQVLGSGDVINEVVVIRNRGGLVNLNGWTLSNARGNVFTFPDITLFPDTQMRIHSTGGRSTPSDLFWGRELPAWGGGELITLRDQAGNVADTYIVP